jgi:hypothetical protein
MHCHYDEQVVEIDFTSIKNNEKSFFKMFPSNEKISIVELNL